VIDFGGAQSFRKQKGKRREDCGPGEKKKAHGSPSQRKRKKKKKKQKKKKKKKRRKKKKKKKKKKEKKHERKQSPSRKKKKEKRPGEGEEKKRAVARLWVQTEKGDDAARMWAGKALLIKKKETRTGKKGGAKAPCNRPKKGRKKKDASLLWTSCRP